MATLESPARRPRKLGRSTPARGPLVPLGRSSDERLARRATKGDARALGEIFERYQQELYRFCLGLLGEPQDAQDALQNTMVKALRALPGEEREIALRPWLYRIAHNEAVDLRRGKRSTQELDQHLLDRHSSVAETAEHREHLQWLLRDFHDLPDRQRAVLVMRELGGLDFAEIGAALGTSGAVVRQTLYEARRNLEQMDFGRGMRCEAVTRVLSDADGRISNRRQIRAHLGDCPDCRHFQEWIQARKKAFAGIAPLPAGGAAGLLPSLLGGAGGSAAGGVTAALGGGAAQSAGTAGILQIVATVAALAVVGTASVERNLHEPQTANDAAAAPLTQRSHADPPTRFLAVKSRSPRQAQPPAHRPSAVSAHAAGNAAPAVTGGRRSGAPAMRDHFSHERVVARSDDDSSSAAPLTDAAESPAGSPQAEQRQMTAKEAEKEEKKAVKQEEKTAETEAKDTSEHPAHPVHPPHPAQSQKPVEPPAPRQEAPEETETALAPGAEGSFESPSHSPNGKAKGHEKQVAG